MDTQILLGQIPMFLHPAPKDVMVIGLGTGVTAGSVLRTAAVEWLDLLEISPDVVEASQYFRDENYDVLDDSRTRLVIADARNYLLATDRQYDVIVSEPSHSWVSGVSNLFTRDFLQLARSRLKDDGVLVQWYHIYGVDRGSLKAMLKGVAEVFPYFSLWYMPGGDLIIASANGPLQLDYRAQSAFFEAPAVRQDLERIGVSSFEEMMGYLLMPSEQIGELLDGVRSNTDDHPVVEFNAPRYIYDFTTEDNIRMLFGEIDRGEYLLPVSNLLEAQPGWLAVPFMGVRVRAGDGGYRAPAWYLARTSVPAANSEGYRLLSGMLGEMAVRQSWGEVAVQSTMTDRVKPERGFLEQLMEKRLPRARQSESGELQAAGIVVYWRVAPAAQAGWIDVVLARRCERRSGFDNYVSFASTYPGDVTVVEDLTQAVQTVNRVVDCIPEDQ